MKQVLLPKFIPVLLFSCCLLCPLAISAKESCQVKFFTRNSKVNLNEIKAFFKAADIVVTRMLPREKDYKLKKTILYTIVLVSEKDFRKVKIFDEGKKGIRFYLPENIKKWTNNDKNIAKIVTSILLKKSEFSADENFDKIPSWLAYGTMAKVLRRLDKANIPGIMTFPGIHMLLTTEPSPDLQKIAFYSIQPGDGPAYSIFLETSEILLTSIRRLPKSQEGIKDFIELSMKGIPPEHSFRKVFGKKVHQMLQNTTEISKLGHEENEEDELKEWLTKNAILMSVNPFKPGGAHFAEKQFRKLEIVRYTSILPNLQKSTEERYCIVENLLEKKEEIKNFPSVVKSKEIEFARLEFAVPAAIQPSLHTVKRALMKLRTDSSFKFKPAYLAAKRQFYDEVEKYNEIENYLKQTESRFVPESWRYRAELEEIGKWHYKTKKRWPTLTKYLDAIEKENNLK